MAATLRSPRPAPLVLLAEDDDDQRAIYAGVLAAAGFVVAEARTAAEALETAAKLVPSVIVMDRHLPDMDGWDATRRLKSQPATREIPVVALTAHVEHASIVAAVEAGCDGFLCKPSSPDALVDAIRSAIGGAAAVLEAPPPPNDGPPASGVMLPRSTRLAIVLKALDDIAERLDGAEETPRVRALRLRAEQYERAVLRWAVQPPREEQRAATVRLVFDLHIEVMALGRDERGV